MTQASQPGSRAAVGGILLPWRRLPFPTDWRATFGVAGPLHLEIGFGDGRYTVRRALEEPDARFVGLEISSASVQRALAKVRRSGVGNVRLMKTGAGFALQQLFAPASLASITVNFPDPWPKERHAKNRLLQRRFFRLAASRLEPGGAVKLATDHPDYLAFALAEAAASELFEVHEATPPPAVFETKYALKWRAQDKPLHYREFRYHGAPAPEFPHLERPEVMPHALLKGTLPEHAPFRKVVQPYGDGHVILHEVARVMPPAGSTPEAPGGASDPSAAGRWLLRATVDEPELLQQLLVVVQARPPQEVGPAATDGTAGTAGGGDIIVRLESFGDPIITKAVRGAVHATTEWLLGATDLTLLERNY